MPTAIQLPEGTAEKQITNRQRRIICINRDSLVTRTLPKGMSDYLCEQRFSCQYRTFMDAQPRKKGGWFARLRNPLRFTDPPLGLVKDRSIAIKTQEPPGTSAIYMEKVFEICISGKEEYKHSQRICRKVIRDHMVPMDTSGRCSDLDKDDGKLTKGGGNLRYAVPTTVTTHLQKGHQRSHDKGGYRSG